MSNGFMLDSDFKTHNIVENITDGIIVTESDHTAIHKGYGYKGLLDVENIAGGASLSWSFVTGENKYIHFKNMSLIGLGASCKVEFIKDADITIDNGTIVPLVNLNLNSGNIASSICKSSPTYTGGTVVDSAYVLTSSTNQFIGSASSSVFQYEEIVLKPNSNYIIKITNLDSTDVLSRVIVKFFFYEEPKGSFFK